jgi:hypothetical protein
MSAQHPTPDDLRTIADNLQAEGQASRAEVIRNAADALAAKDKQVNLARSLIKLNPHSWEWYEAAKKLAALERK